MQITVKTKNLEVEKELKEYAEKKLNKLKKYSDSIISADLTFSTERGFYMVDINIHTTGAVFRGEEKTADFHASIDSAVEKLEKQLKKQKEKLRKPVKSLENIPYAVPDGIPAGGNAQEEDEELENLGLDESITVIRRTNSKPIGVKDAIMDMESRGHGFSVFINSTNGRVNVVYKCKKGYGLIDPIV